MTLKTLPGAIRLLSLLGLALAAGCSSVFQPAPADASIKSALAAYARDLSSGVPSQGSRYSPEMKALLQERRRFYGEFFLNALHSDLGTISSHYDVRSISRDPERGVIYIVRAAELLEFKAKYRLEPGGHPIVKAVAWALERTDDPAVKAELRNLAAMHETAARKNGIGGYDTSFVLEHTLRIIRKWSAFQIIEDAYTDANPQDNPDGTDVIQWQDGTFSRKEPDYSVYPDYSMYHTSIEELGQSLLNDYSQ